jgi:hypothetical protein
MTLRLNTTREAYKEFSQEASGHSRTVDQIPALIAEARVPMNTAQLMQEKLNARNYDQSVQNSYMHAIFDNDDSAIYSPKTRDLLIDLDSETLREIHPNPKRLSNDGRWLLSEDRDEAFSIYNQIKNKPTSVLIKEKYLKNIDEWRKESEVLDCEVWRVLLRHPNEVHKDLAFPGLHKEVIHYLFIEGKKAFGYDKAMSIFLGSAKGNAPEMMPWSICDLKVRSDATAEGRLDIDCIDKNQVAIGDSLSRFIGIAPEKFDPTIKSYTRKDLQDFDNALRGLEMTLKVEPRLLEPLFKLRKKL